MSRITESVDGPLVANLAAKGKPPPLPAGELSALGYDLAIYPSDAFKAALATIRKVYETLIEELSQEAVLDRTVEWGEGDETTNLDTVRDRENRHEAGETAYQE